MIELIIKALESLGLGGYARFFNFWRNRDKLVRLIPEDKKYLVNLTDYSIKILEKYMPEISQQAGMREIGMTYAEFIAYSLPKEGVKAIEDFIVTIADTIEKRRVLKDDKYLRQVANTFKGGEFDKIVKLG